MVYTAWHCLANYYAPDMHPMVLLKYLGSTSEFLLLLNSTDVTDDDTASQYYLIMADHDR